MLPHTLFAIFVAVARFDHFGNDDGATKLFIYIINVAIIVVLVAITDVILDDIILIDVASLVASSPFSSIATSVVRSVPARLSCLSFPMLSVGPGGALIGLRGGYSSSTLSYRHYRNIRPHVGKAPS